MLEFIKFAVRDILWILQLPAFRFRRFGRRSVIKPFPRKIVGAQYIEIGKECFFGDGLVMIATDQHMGVRYSPSCNFGDRCYFGSDAVISCTKSITFGNDVVTSSRVFIGDSYHGYEDVQRPVIAQPMSEGADVVIGDGCFLGIGCAILPGVTLGRNCVVGANAVVTKSFPDYSILVGVPARLIRQYNPRQGVWISGEALNGYAEGEQAGAPIT